MFTLRCFAYHRRGTFVQPGDAFKAQATAQIEDPLFSTIVREQAPQRAQFDFSRTCSQKLLSDPRKVIQAPPQNRRAPPHSAPDHLTKTTHTGTHNSNILQNVYFRHPYSHGPHRPRPPHHPHIRNLSSGRSFPRALLSQTPRRPLPTNRAIAARARSYRRCSRLAFSAFEARARILLGTERQA